MRVESGGPTNAAWKTRPLQIGNPGDPGPSALPGNSEGGEPILTSTQRTTIQAGASTPAANLLAGTAYLPMRAAIAQFQSVASTTTFAAQKYNVGDPKYKAKLDHCLQLM